MRNFSKENVEIILVEKGIVHGRGSWRLEDHSGEVKVEGLWQENLMVTGHGRS